jgi:hypothetical protein
MQRIFSEQREGKDAEAGLLKKAGSLTQKDGMPKMSERFSGLIPPAISSDSETGAVFSGHRYENEAVDPLGNGLYCGRYDPCQ